MTHTRPAAARPPRRARTPGDLLALVPGLLGFHPEDSVVLLTVGDAAQPFHARVDLPRGPGAVETLGDYLAGVAERHGTTRLAVLVYTDDAGLAERFAEALDERLHPLGADLVCAVRADGTRWWLLGRGGGGPGVPYDVSTHPWMAEAVLEGTPVLGSRRELEASLVGRDDADSEAVARLAGRVRRRLRPGPTEPPGVARARLVTEGRWVRRRVRRFLDDRQRLDADDVARLAALVDFSLELRDVAWAEMRHDNAAAHVDLWRDVVRRVPVSLRAPVAALLGFAAWLSGNGALAWCAVDVAQAAEPGHSLASMLEQALAAAVPPTAWTPLPPGALTLFAG